MALTCSFEWLLSVLYQLRCCFRLVNGLSKILPRWIWIGMGGEQQRTTHNLQVFTARSNPSLCPSQRDSRRLLACFWMPGLLSWALLQPSVGVRAEPREFSDVLGLWNFISYLWHSARVCFALLELSVFCYQQLSGFVTDWGTEQDAQVRMQPVLTLLIKLFASGGKLILLILLWRQAECGENFPYRRLNAVLKYFKSMKSELLLSASTLNVLLTSEWGQCDLHCVWQTVY